MLLSLSEMLRHPTFSKVCTRFEDWLYGHVIPRYENPLDVISEKETCRSKGRHAWTSLVDLDLFVVVWYSRCSNQHQPGCSQYVTCEIRGRGLRRVICRSKGRHTWTRGGLEADMAFVVWYSRCSNQHQPGCSHYVVCGITGRNLKE